MHTQFKKARLFDAGGDLSQRWYVFYFYRSPDTGNFVRFRQWISSKILTGSGRRDEAHRVINSLNKKLAQGYNPYANKEKKYSTLILAMDFFLSIKENICRKRTYHTYSSIVNKFKEFLEEKKMERMMLADFNYYHAQDFMDWTMSKGANKNRTHNNRLTAMRTIFNVLIKREWVLFNPFDKIEMLEEEDPLIQSFSIDDLILMQEDLPAYDYNLYACACLIFYCFIRPQELSRLRICDFHLKKRMIIIPGSASKNKKQEVVSIPDPLVPILVNLDFGFPQDYFVFSKKLQRGPVEYAPTRMAEAWKRFADQVGIDKNIYSLKHTGVGMAIESGINVRDLQLQLRHYSLEMTQIYLDKFNRRPSDKLSSMFPDLSRLAKSNVPVHSPLPARIYSPGRS